jgi:hypothetical protein
MWIVGVSFIKAFHMTRHEGYAMGMEVEILAPLNSTISNWNEE